MSGVSNQATVGGRTNSRWTSVQVIGLGITQIIGYGSLYYAFAVLEPAISRDFGWSAPWTFGCFSVALLLGGVAGPLAGRFIDRQGARLALTCGSLAAALAFAALSRSVDAASFLLALIAVELASTLTLYDAAFAAITQIRGPKEARSAITQVTIFGGFASTAFWPLTHFLLGHMSWQEIYQVFAVMHLVICLPIHFLLAVPAIRRFGTTAAAGVEAQGSIPEGHRVRAMVWLVLSFCLTGFTFSALNVHWVTGLAEIGLPAAASIAAGALMGPAQVGVRILDLLFGRRLHPFTAARIAVGFLILALLTLMAIGATYVGAMVFAALFGLSQGLTSIVRGTVPLALFGSAGYGARLGNITAIRLVVTSGAPFAFAVLASALGSWTAFGLLALLALAALISLWAIPQPSGGLADTR
jgi:hypothetical protein